MPATVFTLAETTDRTGYVLGVFADRGMAIDAARSHARHRAERCHAMDENTFGHPEPAGTYELVLQESDAHASLFLVHVPSGERDLVGWQVWPFEVIEPPPVVEAEQPDPFNMAT